jgi:antitoxin FitA
MAGNLHVRNLDDDLIARLKRRAARHGRSTEAEHREILRQALSGDIEPSFDTLAADLRKLTKRRKQTPSEVLLREGFDHPFDGSAGINDERVHRSSPQAVP